MRGVTGSVSMPCSGRSGSSTPGSRLSSQAAAIRPLFSAAAKSSLVEQAGVGGAHEHLVGLAMRQETIAEKALVAELEGMPNAMVQTKPFQNVGFERIDDEQMHGMQKRA